MLLIDIRSTNASAAEFILYRLKLYLAGRHHQYLAGRHHHHKALCARFDTKEYRAHLVTQCEDILNSYQYNENQHLEDYLNLLQKCWQVISDETHQTTADVIRNSLFVAASHFR